MKKWRVLLEETVTYTVEVEAEDRDTAEDRAIVDWCDSDDPSAEFFGEGRGVTTLHAEELES